MNQRSLIVALIVATAMFPLFSSPVSSVSSSDCDVHNYALRNNTYPKWRQISWTYSYAQEPFWAYEIAVYGLYLAGLTWTNQVNTCGALDATTVQHTYGSSTATQGALNNGISEVFWLPSEGYGPSYARFEYSGECDIVLNTAYFDATTDVLNMPDILPTVIAREMGYCIGLADPGAGQLNTMNGGWCEDVFIYYFATRACGLTLSDGDMVGLQLLWPN